MKRVLFIAYLFPPIANSGTQRPLKFTKYLAQHGWEPTVLTAARFDDQRVDEGLLAEMPRGLRVVRVPMVNEAIDGAITSLGCHTRLACRLGGAIRWRMQARFRMPDLYALWRPTATRAALRLHRARPFDAIYATGFPWTSLLVGRDAARATGLPLVADFRDPWSSEDLFRDGRPPRDRERALERSVIEQAAAIISVSDTLTRQLTALYPDVNELKFHTIANGFDPADLEGPSAAAPREKFRIAFAGVWKAGYNPSPLYDVIEWIARSHPALLEGVEVVAAGFEPGEAARRHLNKWIKEVGVLPHREAVALMHSADVLFMTNGDGVRQQLAVPGKLYEYLATGRPVIALTDPDGDAGRLLRLVGGGVAVPTDDPGALLEAITAVCRDRALQAPPRNLDALSAYSRPNLAGRLASLLDAATSRTPLPDGPPHAAPPAPAVLRLRPR